MNILLKKEKDLPMVGGVRVSLGGAQFSSQPKDGPIERGGDGSNKPQMVTISLPLE